MNASQPPFAVLGRSVLGASLIATALALAGCATAPAPADKTAATWPPAMAVIGHRGASALRPEHTLASYQQAIDDGADIIEPDLVITKDGVLVARHENAIAIVKPDGSLLEATTNVADKPEFASRKTTKQIDGKPITGWFVEDFTLAELKTLRARERIPAIRPANAQFNDRFEVPTLQEVIDLAKAQTAKTGRTIGIYPETKHPTYFQSIGLPLEAPLLATLQKNGWNRADAPVLIQSFEVSNLRALKQQTPVRLMQLVSPKGQPYDFVAQGKAEGFADLLTDAGLRDMRSYAWGIAPSKSMVLPVEKNGEIGAVKPLVAQAQAAGLQVHVWTLRPENNFLPAAYRSAPVDDKTQRGRAADEMRAFVASGVNGIFTDDPAVLTGVLRQMGQR